jgi:hypothetical protein
VIYFILRYHRDVATNKMNPRKSPKPAPSSAESPLVTLRHFTRAKFLHGIRQKAADTLESASLRYGKGSGAGTRSSKAAEPLLRNVSRSGVNLPQTPGVNFPSQE